MSKYKIEPWTPQPNGGMQTGKIPAGVKVTDTETGHWHCCNIYRSQHQNKDHAIRTLKALQETSHDNR